ncbi:MAG: twin-arginine translocase subunit TatC [Thermodesulfobacteriota bacterium]|nr:MAG: twin-arginine translocase subunit TatC [Thermodesulfobacteriota bacterium]
MSFEHLPFRVHLVELRRRLITCFVTMAVTFAICYAFSDLLVSILFYPVHQALPPGSSLVFTALTEGFMTYLKVAFWSAVILSTPMILYQAWMFAAPGLYDKEKKLIKSFMFWGTGLFISGGLFGYWVIMPVAFSITLGFANQGLEAMPRLQNYMIFSLKAIFVFGMVFEIPFLMALATRCGIVSTGYFSRHRRAGYIALYVLAVLLVPTDVFSQVLIFFPLIGVYEAGIRLAMRFGAPA